MNYLSLHNLQVSSDFSCRGYQVFDGVLHEFDIVFLATHISKCITSGCIQVSEGGIQISTVNGEELIQQVPAILGLYKATFSILKKSIPKLMMLEDMPVAVSANLLIKNRGDVFRYHFDRNDITAVLYLTDNCDMPLSLYPNIRSDPINNEYVWHYSKDNMAAIEVYPVAGRLVIFNGRRTLHGVVSSGIDGYDSGKRLSLQFAFDTRTRSFVNQEYYGRYTKG